MMYSALFLNARHAAPREDALAVDTERRIFIAADGVTRDWDALAEGRCPYPNPSPATLAADAVADTSLRWVQQSADDGSSNVLLVADALRAANEAVDHLNVALHLYECCDYLEHDLAGAVAAVAEISGDTLTTGWVGDCGVAVVRAGQLVFLTRDQVEDTITHLRANPAPFNDQRRAYVRRELRNRPDVAHPSIITYGVLTGEREAMRYIETASFDLQPGDVVATHTDGFRPYFANRDFLALLSDEAARWESDIPAFTLELAERDREYGRERSIVLYKHAG